MVAALGAAAQSEGGYNESVVVKGSYRPVIEQATKMTFPAVISDSLGRLEHEFNYSISPSRLKALYEPSRLKAARIIGEPATKLYNNYLRLGFGNYWTPLADLYWSSTRDKKKTYGIRLNHLSSWGSLGKVGDEDLPDAVRNYGADHFGNTAVTLFGKYIVGEKLQLAADIGYEHDHNLYYGFNDSTLLSVMGVPRDSISISDYRASYNVATFNVGLRNMQLDPDKFGYGADLHLADLWGVYGQNELNVSADGNVHYGFNVEDKYKGVVYLVVGWEGYWNTVGDADMPLGYNAALVADTFSGHIVRVNPYVDFLAGGFQFHTGALVGWDGYSFRGNGPGFSIYPDVIVSRRLLGGRLALSLAATGGIDVSNWNTMRRTNPYIAPDVAGRASSHYDFTFHTRWTLSRKLEMAAEVEYSIVDNDLSFQIDTDYALRNVYRPAYFDDHRLSAGGTVTFVNDEMLTLRAAGHYYHYDNVSLVNADELNDMTDYDKPLYRPDWDASLAADVNYHDRWLFHLEGGLVGSMTADGGEVLPIRYGISAEVEYRHNRALSFFLRGDNLAFQRYWLWCNYPSQRGLVMAGLTYTIPTK